MDASIGGTTVTLIHGTVHGDMAVGQRSGLSFVVYDPMALYAFQEGQPVILYNDDGSVAMRRWVGSAQRQRTTQGGLLEHAIACVDNHYLADKRIAATTYTSQTAQYIVNDLLAQYLLDEGVYTVKNVLTANQSDVESGITGFTQNGGGTTTFIQAFGGAWQGNDSLEVTTDGTAQFQGVYAGVPWSSLRAGATYTFSVYLKAGVVNTVHLVAQMSASPFTTYGDVTTSLQPSWTRASVTFTLPATLPSTGVLALSVQTGAATLATTWYMDGLQCEPDINSAGATTWEVGGTSGVAGGSITIGAFTANYAQVSACLDAICQKAGGGYTWWIDDNRRLWFQQANPTPAPLTITDALFERDSERVTHGNPLYRNTQYVLGGTAETTSQNATFAGDGKSTAFTVGYPLASAPTITLNGGAQTVGIKGVDTGKNWYWAKGDPVITQDSSGTVLISTDTLAITYTGQYPVVTVSTDSAGVASRQSREGGSTSGIVESVATDTTLNTTTDAFDAAASYLARYSQDTLTLEFMTQQSGFAQGQLATVNVPAYQLNNTQMLLESVTITDVGPAGSEVGVLYYTIKCVVGPLNTTWVQFYQALASQGATLIDSINLGNNTSVAILQSGTATWTWTVTGSATVNSLLIPSSTLYPSATLYPGTAGTPVTITWTKPNVALDALRDILAGAGSSLDATYFAWGTGTQGTPATATTLATEVGRKAVTSVTDGSNVGEALINGYLGPQDAVGVAITEVAFFAGPSASGTANSGVLLLYGLYSHTHTASESIQFVADSTFS